MVLETREDIQSAQESLIASMTTYLETNLPSLEQNLVEALQVELKTITDDYNQLLVGRPLREETIDVMRQRVIDSTQWFTEITEE